MSTLSHDFGLTNRNGKVFIKGLIADIKALSVKVLVFEENNHFFGSNSRFEKTFIIFSIVRSNCDQSRNIGIPRSKALGMLSSHGSCWPIQASEYYPSTQLSTTHVVQLRRTIDDMVDGLERKVHRHELNHRSKSHERSSTANSSKTCFSNGGVPQSLRSVLVNESFGNFVGAMVIGNLFSDDEDVWVSGKFFIKCFIECFSVGDFCKVSAELMSQVSQHLIMLRILIVISLSVSFRIISQKKKCLKISGSFVFGIRNQLFPCFQRFLTTNIEISHRACQTFMQNVLPHVEKPHHQSPNQPCQNSEAIFLEKRSIISFLFPILSNLFWKVFLVNKLGQSYGDSAKEIEIDLIIDGSFFAEDQTTNDKASYKTIERTISKRFFQDKADQLIEEYESAKFSTMLPCIFENSLDCL